MTPCSGRSGIRVGTTGPGRNWSGWHSPLKRYNCRTRMGLDAERERSRTLRVPGTRAKVSDVSMGTTRMGIRPTSQTCRHVCRESTPAPLFSTGLRMREVVGSRSCLRFLSS